MNTTKLVRDALASNLKLRDDDRLLTLAVWEKEGLYLTDKQKRQFMQVASMDFISRRRRELMVKYPPSEQAFNRRHKFFRIELDRYSHSKWFNKRLRDAD